MIKDSFYRLGDLFKIDTGKDLIYSYLIPGEFNVIGHGIENNGITATTEFLSEYKLYDPGKTIALANRGNFYASVQTKKFYVGTRVKALTAKFNSNIYILMYIATIINMESYRFSYGRNACDKIDDIKIKLPTLNGAPDYNYMESYIKNRFDKTIITSNINKKNMHLDTSKWENYKLSDLFKMERGTRLIEENREHGNIPFVTAGYLNEGITEKINNKSLKIYSKALTIDMFGNCFYRDYNFCCDDNILVLKNENLNKYILLFICTIINKDKYKYNYGRQYRQKDFYQHFIKLPSNGSKPDYEYMCNYMKQMLFSDKI